VQECPVRQIRGKFQKCGTLAEFLRDKGSAIGIVVIQSRDPGDLNIAYIYPLRSTYFTSLEDSHFNVHSHVHHITPNSNRAYLTTLPTSHLILLPSHKPQYVLQHPHLRRFPRSLHRICSPTRRMRARNVPMRLHIHEHRGVRFQWLVLTGAM
jgi:hypothetical protein